MTNQVISSFAFLLLTVVIIGCTGQKEAARDSGDVEYDKEGYIKEYKNIAVQEMKRTGIPASITLAQGILESSYGRSMLARKANNHFGIKCHSSWDGPTVRKDDDKKNECFRKYERPQKSFIDHSDFLTTRPRYSFLFDYDKTAYKKWARGLKRAGYATNPDYADELISIIEKYNLDKYDKMEQGDLQVEEAKEKLSSFEGEVIRHNKVKAVIVQPQQSWLDIAKEHEIRLNRLHRYNDYYARYFENLVPGNKVYLQPKRLKGDRTTHKVKKGETMYTISQEHGIRLEKLYERNKMEEGEEPKAGQKLLLKGKREEKPALKTQKELNQTLDYMKKKREERRKLFLDGGKKAKQDVQTDQSGSEVEQRTDTTHHIVSEGETLYGISHQYYVPVNELKDVNNIESGDLEPGQRLTIPPNARSAAKARNTGKENDAATEQKEDNDTKESGKSNQGVKEAADTTKSTDETAKETTSSKDPEKNKEEQVGQDSASQQSGEGSTNTTNNQDNTKSEARTDHNKPSNNKKKEAKPAGTTDKPADKSSREQQQRSDQQEEKVETTLHSVNPGETLYSIAQQYGTTVEKIKQINNLSANNLAVAQELKVPDNREDVPQQGNQLPEEPSDDAKTVIIHVVKEGQTLYSISQNYNTSVDEILQANDNLETTQIETGQKIKIPDKEGKKNQSQEDTRQNKSSDKKTHTVKPGETLYSISQEYNVSVKKIKEWNNLSSNNLEVGQELRIKK